ncbi:MAG TPA: hypothetical protein VJX91_00135 [Candidatus Eisenbacteria bacterium]|nr:hypothetical protein [Candidatus Eisenbacteria bacterium]
MSARLAIEIDGQRAEGDAAIQAILQVLVAIGATADLRGCGRSQHGMMFNVPRLDGSRGQVHIVRASLEPVQAPPVTGAEATP